MQIFVSQQLLFLFSKHLDTMSNVTYCDTGQKYLLFLWYKCYLLADHLTNPQEFNTSQLHICDLLGNITF